MSKSKLPEQTNSEEIDLGQLFKLIGNVFDRFIRFIAGIFTGVYRVFILLLIHFYNRLYWYAGAIIIGVIIGFVLEKSSVVMYGANMYIETNFQSSRQVYENVMQFNQLASKDKDTIELSKRLNITPSEASNLKNFGITPDSDENVLAKMYSDFYSQLDTISRESMTFDRYKSSLKPYNFNIHKIEITSKDKFIYKKIEKDFIDQISGNSYLNELVEVNKQNIDKKDEVLVKEIQKTDSLLNEYLKIRINQSQKELVPGSGTNLFMGNAESNNLVVNESNIIDKILALEAQRRELNTERITQNNVINVLANFPESGYDIREWYDKMKFIMPLVLFSLTLIVFTFIGLGKFLDKQSKKL